MKKGDYHIHTSFCDGKKSAEDMVQGALEKDMMEIGFTSHGYTPFDDSFCMSQKGTKEYIEEIKRLKKKYKGKINILLGTEADFYSEFNRDDYDYVIGSVHYIEHNGIYISVDESKENFIRSVDEYFGGNPYIFTEKFFKNAGNIIEKTGCNIIGHFDLVSIFNDEGDLFNENDERYIRQWKDAVDRLIPYGIPFELNTGGIARGYRRRYYPCKEIRKYIGEKGGSFVFTSDSHDTKTIGYGFEEAINELEKEGLAVTDFSL